MPVDEKKLIAEAEAGSVVAQGVLGICYLYGHDVPVDYARALDFLQRAAARGASRPTLHLGHMYRDGLGVARDDEKAFELYEAAATRGEFEAQICAARMYASGRGTDVDVDAAKHWYAAALTQAGVTGVDAELAEARDFIRRHSDTS